MFGIQESTTHKVARGTRVAPIGSDHVIVLEGKRTVFTVRARCKSKGAKPICIPCNFIADKASEMADHCAYGDHVTAYLCMDHDQKIVTDGIGTQHNVQTIHGLENPAL